MGCHFLLQCMKMKSESEVTQSHPTLLDPRDCSLPGTSIHGIFQARVLEWVAIAFSCLPLVLLKIKHFQKESKREGKVKMQEPHIPLSIALGNARPCFLTWHFQLPPTQLAPRPAPRIPCSFRIYRAGVWIKWSGHKDTTLL